jgi:SNF2 family DNA or RNA helicase
MDITGFEEEIRTDLLSRLCSHPAILYARVDQIFKDQKPYNDIIELFPPCYSPQDCYINESGKLLALFQLVTSLNSRKEKCAIVSKRTNSLDLIEAMFKKIEFDVYRLDLESMTIKEIIIRKLVFVAFKRLKSRF